MPLPREMSDDTVSHKAGQKGCEKERPFFGKPPFLTASYHSGPYPFAASCPDSPSIFFTNGSGSLSICSMVSKADNSSLGVR